MDNHDIWCANKAITTCDMDCDFCALVWSASRNQTLDDVLTALNNDAICDIDSSYGLCVAVKAIEAMKEAE